MVKEPKRSKSESLSLRLDPKAKFVLDFVARVEARSITTIVERAIREYAGRIAVGPERDDRGNEIERQTWSDFWDPSDGVRALKMLAEPELRTTYEDDELHSFTMAHQPFFYADVHGKLPRRAYVEILWPEIRRFLEIWKTEKGENFWSAGEHMKKRLSAARVQPPVWPPPPRQTMGRSPPQGGGDLDDDIPF